MHVLQSFFSGFFLLFECNSSVAVCNAQRLSVAAILQFLDRLIDVTVILW